eukprot:GHRR01019834.1.p2 GENE.GHRR01019834.1~~GHRR01019834.1.p2  ORF type:complete len:139 (-),score=37.25 GHRR01019834.1:5-421(-)
MSHPLANAQEMLDAASVQPQAQAGGGSVHNSPTAVSATPADAMSKQESVDRVSSAVQSILTSGLTSDYVDGLKPVLHQGKLQISTHILLPGEQEPVFLGMFPSLPAAVQAQKQTQALVSGAVGWATFRKHGLLHTTAM